MTHKLQIDVGRCDLQQATFIHMWWKCTKLRLFWRKPKQEMEKTVGFQVLFHPHFFLLHDFRELKTVVWYDILLGHMFLLWLLHYQLQDIDKW